MSMKAVLMHSVVLLYLKHLYWRYGLDQEMDFSEYYKKTKIQ